MAKEASSRHTLSNMFNSLRYANRFTIYVRESFALITISYEKSLVF